MKLRCFGQAIPGAGLAVTLVLAGSAARGQGITVNGRPLLALTKEYMIVPGLGQQVGSNLFHSFGAFNLSQGETATFSGPTSVANVIGRVTGGTPSSIDGTVRSTIQGANVYLINPAGVVFGSHAQLAVLGSFHASSADYLLFEDHTRLQAANPAASTLTAAAPTAFGFLLPNPRPITVDSAILGPGPTGQGVTATLGLVGGPIKISGGFLSAPAGTMHIVSVAGPGEVSVNPRSALAPTVANLGPVRIENGSQVIVSDPAGGASGGSVFIRAGSLNVANSLIDADNFGPGSGGMVSLRGDRAVTISNTGTVMDRDPHFVHAVALNAGRGADISIGTSAGGTVTLDNARVIVGSSASGAGGTLSITVPGGTLVVQNGALAQSAVIPSANGTPPQAQILGNAGAVTVQANNITLRSTGRISSLVTGVGGGGALKVTAAGELFISDAGTDPKTLTGISAQSSNLATKPGDIMVRAGSLTIDGRGVIDTATFGRGNAGNVTVVVSGALSITGRGGSAPPARIASIPSETPSGTGGANAGQVVVQAGSLTLSNGGNIGADTAGTSPGGLVQVSADSVNLRDGGVISSTTAATGEGGPVAVTVRGDLVISNAGKDLTGISAQTGARATGKAGQVTVRAANLTIVGQGQIDATTAGAGDAGQVTVRVPGAILIDGRGGSSAASISSETVPGSNGKGGQVVVKAGTLTLRNGGQISSATAGSGWGGDVSVTASSNILLTGPGPQITATSTGTGNAGSITVSAPRLSLRNGASISTEAQSTDGGNITISVRDLLYLQQRSSITTSVTRAVGNGGNITIDPRFVILDRSVIAANAVGGKGGNLLIRADQFVPSANSAVTATSQRNVPGTITISSPPPNLTGSLVVLAGALRAAAAVLTESCAAHGADPRSSLVMAGRGGLRHDPGTTLPALYIANRPSGASQNHAPKAAPVRPQQTSVSLSARCG